MFLQSFKDKVFWTNLFQTLGRMEWFYVPKMFIDASFLVLVTKSLSGNKV